MPNVLTTDTFAIAAAGFGNDTEAVFSPVFGSEPEVSDASAQIANIAEPLGYMAREFPDLDVTYFILHDPATAGQHSQVIAEHPDRLIFGEYYNFTSAGEYEGNVGISDGTVGQQITGAVYNVHFGNWGGLPVKLAYLVFGIALCTIIASGLSVYFAKRETNGRPAPRLAAIWTGLVWGTPTMLAATLVAALAGLEGIALVAIFWLGLLISLVASWVAGKERVSLAGKALLLGALCLSLAIYLARYGSDAFASSGLGITLVGLALVVGLTVWIVKARSAVSRAGQLQSQAATQPAE